MVIEHIFITELSGKGMKLSIRYLHNMLNIKLENKLQKGLTDSQNFSGSLPGYTKRRTRVYPTEHNHISTAILVHSPEMTRDRFPAGVETNKLAEIVARDGHDALVFRLKELD